MANQYIGETVNLLNSKQKSLLNFISNQNPNVSNISNLKKKIDSLLDECDLSKKYHI